MADILVGTTSLLLFTVILFFSKTSLLSNLILREISSILDIIRDIDISDQQKENEVRRSSIKLLQYSLRLLFHLFLISVIPSSLVGICILLEITSLIGIANFLTSWLSVGICLALFTLMFLLKKA